MFVCSNCQKTYLKWQGQCDNCKLWNTLVETENTLSPKSALKKGKSFSKSVTDIKPVRLSDLEKDAKIRSKKEIAFTTGIYEFDNTIGGRIVPGQVFLFSGEPGVGKSTLSLQITETLSNLNLNILYVCGEESPIQIKHRADRLKLKLRNVMFLPDVNMDSVETYIVSHRDKIDCIIVDSIQTMFDPNILGSSGNVAQISECTNRIVNLAKGYNIVTFIIGHVTKSGDIAGPKIMEHMVDTVLYLEGDKRYEFRVLRVEKNRYGSSDEVGIFRMTAEGLVEVKDTKDLFNKNKEDASGSVYALVMEGTRPVVVEVQALATRSYFSNPRRTTSGFDLNRLYIILAIIDKKLHLHTGEFDIYVNITGGIKITDPGLDLAVMQAIVSSVKDTIVPKTNIYFGEVGLTGEIRKVFMEDKRLKEAKRLEFKNIYSSNSYKNIQQIAKD
ncbi:DNA repair protein RadA [Candidatus Dojkabacteria bacterium]|nr:DNA repair protein RadA [Candidatus Dojkabacteria bacterium]